MAHYPECDQYDCLECPRLATCPEAVDEDAIGNELSHAPDPVDLRLLGMEQSIEALWSHLRPEVDRSDRIIAAIVKLAAEEED